MFTAWQWAMPSGRLALAVMPMSLAVAMGCERPLFGRVRGVQRCAVQRSAAHRSPVWLVCGTTGALAAEVAPAAVGARARSLFQHNNIAGVKIDGGADVGAEAGVN